tara:strand:+ start:5058 stop:5570 length:513 start_codon:yes stop_codon:yes gene_type:complete
MFSQSGKEIVEISKKLGRWPDHILTTNMDKYSVHKDLVYRSATQRSTHNRLIKEIEMLSNVFSNPLITLHGYLRIMPDLPYEMYNGHPGDIVTYPELVGKDPQKKAIEMSLPSTGCVIHKVTQDLDRGPIVSREEYIMEGDEDELILIDRLRIISINMWVKFLEEKLNEC